MSKNNKKAMTIEQWRNSVLNHANLKLIKESYTEAVGERLIANIRTIMPINKIIGYGSLLKKSDAERSFDKMIDHRIAYIDEYRRIFNFGKTYKGSWLNVEHDAAAHGMPVALITINADDMLAFYEREALYDNVLVTARVPNVDPDGDRTFSNINAVMVIVRDKLSINPSIEPMLSYANLCTQGMKEIGDQNDLASYLNNTRLTDGSSLNTWYNNLNVLDYIKRHTHQTR